MDLIEKWRWQKEFSECEDKSVRSSQSKHTANTEKKKKEQSFRNGKGVGIPLSLLGTLPNILPQITCPHHRNNGESCVPSREIPGT